MSRLFKGYTLNEGYNDLGTLSVDITFVESPAIPQTVVNDEPEETNAPVFQLIDSATGFSLPGLKIIFTIDGFGTDPDIVSTQFANSDGFAEFPIPQLPTVLNPSSSSNVPVKSKINGTPEDRTDEAYLKVAFGGTTYYTLITNLSIANDKLNVFDGDSTQYVIQPQIDIPDTLGAIAINSVGDVYGYTTSTETWAFIDTLEFWHFSNPAGLNQPVEGFYTESGTSGTKTQGTLGGTGFEQYTIELLNPQPCPVEIDFAIYEPDGVDPIHTGTLDPILPDTRNITKIDFAYSPVTPADDSPTIGDIETASGITFSTDLKTYLATNNLDTVLEIRRAGPLKYLPGIPGPSSSEVGVLQSYVDLFFLTNNLAQCTDLRTAGFESIYSIAEVSRNNFLDALELEPEDLYEMARLHEIAVQRISLISNVLAASLNDIQLAEPVNYASATGYSIFKPNCGCDDCKSGISPFAYLSDLLKYGATHVIKNPGYSPTSPVNYSAFITLMQNTFYQPFGQYPVDCDTLHQEFCRVRLATEVLLKLKDFVESGIDPARLAAYVTEYDQYLQLTYNNLLLQMGTSFDEIRSVYIAPPSTKDTLSAKLAAKLGIPFFAPEELPTEVRTTDILWLSLTETGDHELTEIRLEEVFGFRNTARDVLTNPASSLMENWRAAYLKDVWSGQDYPLSSYTREGIDNPSTPTILSQWKPIIDPDIMGLDDVRYYPDLPYNTVIPGLYDHRMEDTDEFLDHYLGSSFSDYTSADMTFRKVKTVYPNNVAGDVIEDDEIQLENGTPAWITFKLNNRIASGTDTTFILANLPTEPAMFQPNGTSPEMRYKRRVNVDSYLQQASNNFQITLPTSAADLLAIASGGYAKLLSVNGATELAYETTASSPWNISAVVVDTNPNIVTLTLSNEPDATFLEGTLYFIYRKEVSIFIDSIPDPVEMVDELFDVQQSYDYYSTGDFDYYVWNASSWEAPLSVPSTYAGLKTVYNQLSSGINIPENTTSVTDGLHLTLDQFNRMMELFIICENYLLAMYTNPRPTAEQLYELTSIFRISAKASLNPEWVEEEITYEVSTVPINLKLTANNFWKPILPPASGVWNPLLQTNTASTPRPMIDPEFVKESDIHEGPAGATYRQDLSDRITDLDGIKTTLLGYQATYGPTWFEKILNKINQDNPATAYVIPDYASLTALLADLNSVDPFKIQHATESAYTAFSMSKEEFLRFIDIKSKYENENPTEAPTALEIDIAMDLGVLGYKRHEFYSTWLTEESAYKYYDIFKMQLDLVRGNQEDRSEWLLTLEKWSRQPFVDPDIVPAENLVNFVVGDPAYDYWVERLDFYETRITAMQALFNSGVTMPDRFYNYKDLLCTALFNDTSGTSSTNPSSLPYFLELKTREEAGENIQPRLEQLNTTMSEYRMLRKIYDVIDGGGASTLIDSEYQDVYDILLDIEKKQRHFSKYVLEEYQGDIIAVPSYVPILLSNVEFKIYKPAPNTFPLTDLPVYNTWRSPFRVRRDWLNILEGRIDMEQQSQDAWEKVLMATEDITLQALRNALIRVLAEDCETFDETAERLAKSLFIETKDNCCARHTRISQAIETIQGFYFAMKNGVYDEYLSGFDMQAPNFDEEWQWLGSYATWRSAMFVFLFPENLLYPTLKRYQTPAFRILAKEIQEAARLTPEGACIKAKAYEDYFNDILNLDIKFTTTIDANKIKQGADICCEESIYQTRFTFFFAQSKISGKSYWSAKPHDDNSGYAHSFWEEIEGLDKVELLAGFAVHRENIREIQLYYSYKKDGKLKLAFISKDMTSQKGWSGENEITIPLSLVLTPSNGGLMITVTQYVPPVGGQNPTNPTQVTTTVPAPTPDPVTVSTEPFAITIAQNSLSWDYVSFIFSYKVGDESYHVHVRFKNDHRLEFELPEPMDQNSFWKSSVVERPVTAIRHSTESPSPSGINLYGLTIIFEKYLVSVNYNLNSSDTQFTRKDIPESPAPTAALSSLIGAYQKRGTGLDTCQLIIIYRDVFDNTQVVQLAFGEADATTTPSSYSSSSFSVLSGEFQQFTKVCPIYSEYESGNVLFAIKSGSDPSVAWASSVFEFDNVTPNILVDDLFGLAPRNVVVTPIESGHCVDSFQTRKANIMALMQANLNDPIMTSSTLEYLTEAYYFVPMLLALDQQRRGQYEAALDWYRTVYDYTQNATTNRKIFYGLVLEESLINVFNRPADWLLDPLNPHLIARTRANAYTRYTIVNIAQCLTGYGDREFTTDTSESVPRARQLYTAALELLQVNELNVAPNDCIVEAHCFPAEIAGPFTASPYENLFNFMQDELATLYDPTVLNQTREDIIDVFENETLTIPEQFAEIFDLIATAQAGLITTPSTVEEVIEGAGERMNVALRFLEAPLHLGNATQGFIETVSGNYDYLISQISGISVEDLNNHVYNDSIVQLAFADPLISESFGFQFMNASGVQQFTGNEAYNPLYPSDVSRIANLRYSNTNAFSSTRAGMANQYIYTPLVDYIFCNPSNPVYDSLKLKLNVELYKIFNCRNIAGMIRELDVYGAPTDSTTGIPFIGAQGNLVLPALNAFKPSQYRFSALIERAKQIVQYAQQVEAQFLSVLEKRDAEYYNLLAARQDLQTARATIKLQDLRVKQAQDEKGLAEIQYDRANYSYTNYNNWITGGLNGFEVASLALLQTAVVIEGLAAAANFGAFWDSKAQAQGLSAVAQATSMQASIFSQIASYERRQQEWEYQRQLADFDIDLANQQIKIAEDNIRIIGQEREIAQINADHANETLEFLKNKFTNAELYNWMGNILEGVYAYLLNLCTAVARTAEGQLYFERQELAGPFIQDDYWVSPADNYTASLTRAGNADRRGLTGSARLLQDIFRLDQYAFDTNKRKLQLTKTISLSQNFPEAFQRFRETGVLNFELTNQLFDHDYPGHYLRLINSVKTSVIGLVPVYGGIKASLTADTISYVVIGGNTFQRIPINRMHNESVALCSPSNATGLFEMTQLNGEMLNPFEGMGVESRWEFKMPKFSNRMDFDQVADVLITIEYTALDSFIYRTQVLNEINREISFNRAFSFKNNFPDQWYELANVLSGVDEFGVTFTTKREDFPAGVDIQYASRLVLYFVRADNSVDEINIADFNITSNANTYAGTTVNGIFNAQNLLLGLTNPLPFQTWRLEFDNTGDVNRLLFLNEDITDILFVITCNGELPEYPM